jgi:hypothetical protein
MRQCSIRYWETLRSAVVARLLPLAFPAANSWGAVTILDDVPSGGRQ